ncbi:ArfGAP with coiled-coil, ankyrin repeat and PH domains 2 [Homo sapiens]|uniref:ArfGAP with coiled-coil, ankyrin repeat and PH domains 2 n=1 Tax=Homo sapiens TaxID=9606 RepID=F8WAU0_HUMAN|nr:ArfGAP with coiled-coil, ankyrin repeat and PH domains 2 [Homo sapiens]KAI4033147.1 ArfGAP with coiled-coil, ankyrin repeat and PH domains 2 [Homo sapiens]
MKMTVDFEECLKDSPRFRCRESRGLFYRLLFPKSLVQCVTSILELGSPR